MHRTANRPLPAGRLAGREVLIARRRRSPSSASPTCSLAVPQPLAAGVTGVHVRQLPRPLHAAEAADDAQHAGRRRARGAAAGDRLGRRPRPARRRGDPAVFLILFVWQVPHFLAIAWMYRDDYARAGLKMLSVGDRKAARTAHQMLLYGLALVPVSLAPAQIGMGGPVYAFGAALLGCFFLWPIARFQGDRSIAAARRVLRASLVYLPGIYGLLLIAKFW